MAYDAAARGGLAPAIMNAANEMAVAAFLAGKSRFIDIFSTVEQALARTPSIKQPSLTDIIAADADVRARLAG
jgi:1-deoxy-D-xylulose-5-phosphate reductoisomerase